MMVQNINYPIQALQDILNTVFLRHSVFRFQRHANKNYAQSRATRTDNIYNPVRCFWFNSSWSDFRL